jgi:hypothetical protein
VPSTEDVGIDTVATLLRPESSKRLIPEDTFAVQFKASSVDTVEYPDVTAATWLMNLQLPFFIGRVRMKDAAVDLFPTHRLFQVKETAALREVYLHLEEHPGMLGATDVAHVVLGPPAYSWTVSDLADKSFHDRIYPILKEHIRAAQRNITARPYGYYEMVPWVTGEMPKPFVAFGMQHGGTGGEASNALKAMVAPIQTLLTHISHLHRPALLPTMFEFVKLMRSLGEDPDKGDVLTLMSAISACRIEIDAPSAVQRDVIVSLLTKGMSPNWTLIRWLEKNFPDSQTPLCIPD